MATEATDVAVSAKSGASLHAIMSPEAADMPANEVVSGDDGGAMT
ncbi:MAG TPA: hypothetical protein VME47_10630 [Acetobacteraceae bacterium]|nr:hypothetical protein [Acetobacteraceae bacterium]